VNNQLIEDESIREEARLLKDRARAEMPELDELALTMRVREWARENVIMRVLFQQAQERIATITAEVPRPKPNEVASFYRKSTHLFQAPEMVRASHIVKHVDEGTTEVQAEAAIRAIENRLKAGAAFAHLADTCSDCPGQGGDLGFFARGGMVVEFEDAVFGLPKGATTAVFQTIFGFHLATVTDRRSPGLKPLKEVREAIEQSLWQRQKDLALTDFMNRLRSQADIRKV
jgi:parvulin-like peptidyl-prolyl isomerase